MFPSNLWKCIGTTLTHSAYASVACNYLAHTVSSKPVLLTSRKYMLVA